MCKPDYIKTKAPPITRSSSSLLSVDAFETKPSLKSMGMYGSGTLAFLFAVEYAVRYLFDEFQHMHALLENETNRLILARHIGTDFLCCWLVALMGITSFTTVCPDLLSAAAGKTGAMPKAGFESRMFTYRPAGFRICLFFLTYQIKNMFDTVVWNDGLLFVGHHVMCIFVAYGSIFHGVAHFWAPFYFGVSEVSTGILCLLANFDDDHGVPGLADAYPQGKVFVGGLFAVAFIICRVVFWSFCSYYFVTDALLAINKTDSTRDTARPWVNILLGSLTGLSVLQVIWLGQIVAVGMEEFGKMSA